MLQIESELLYFRKHFGVSGVFAAAFLATAGDVMKACNGLVRGWDTAQADRFLRHAIAVLKSLIDTALASRATR